MNQAETATRIAERAETITRLNALTSLDWTVDADALDRTDGTPEVATDRCAHGEGCSECGGSGWGTCYFHDADGLCPSEAVRVITAGLVAGAYIAVDVVL